MYLGWRMILPLLPTTLSLAALSLAAMGKGWVRSPAAILFFIAAMGLPLATTVDAAFGRPETCRKVSGACLQDAPRLWPTTLKNYVCDLSNARQDRAFAAAVNATFGTAVSVGQTDYLRAALHMDGKVLDYSGLINADIAHQPGLASANGSSFQSILAGAPDIFLPCCRLISDKRFSSAPRLTRDTWLEHFPGSNHVFPQGTAREQRRFMALYTGASVDLGNGQFFNFLLHRRARVQASAGGRISVIP